MNINHDIRITDEICKPLPSELTKQVNTSETREEFIVDFLKKRLPASDIKGISDELTKVELIFHTGK